MFRDIRYWDAICFFAIFSFYICVCVCLCIFCPKWTCQYGRMSSDAKSIWWQWTELSLIKLSPMGTNCLILSVFFSHFLGWHLRSIPCHALLDAVRCVPLICCLPFVFHHLFSDHHHHLSPSSKFAYVFSCYWPIGLPLLVWRSCHIQRW